MTIYMYLQAGLGNQLFMIFALISYALDHNVKYKIMSHIDKTMNGTKTYWNDLLAEFKNVLCEDNTQMKEYHEPTFTYNQIPCELTLNENVLLKGFFQSYKYFEHNYDKLVKIMNLREKIQLVKEEYKYLFEKKTIALHFRIGDYLFLQNYHCIKGPDYYAHAIRFLEFDLKNRGEDIAEYNILYFSQPQDEQYINEYMKVLLNLYDTSSKYNFVKVPYEIDDWKQMLLMSLCQHFIIANSTFSWFGAYFSESVDKIVYYPQVWFGPALHHQHDIKYLCPSSWKCIK
jgi:hypothetical protein